MLLADVNLNLKVVRHRVCIGWLDSCKNAGESAMLVAQFSEELQERGLHFVRNNLDPSGSCSLLEILNCSILI